MSARVPSLRLDGTSSGPLSSSSSFSSPRNPLVSPYSDYRSPFHSNFSRPQTLHADSAGHALVGDPVHSSARGAAAPLASPSMLPLSSSPCISTSTPRSARFSSRNIAERTLDTFRESQNIGRFPEFTPRDRLANSSSPPVLRFDAFFKESVSESEDESVRVRKVRIRYYTEDQKLEIVDWRQPNAGMAQGFLLKKMQVPGGPNNQDTSRVLQPQDFLPGSDVMIYGKMMHVVRCDSVARDYLEQRGFSVRGAEDFPEDEFEKRRSQIDRKVAITNVHPTTEKPARQFFESEGVVLEFYGKWDDPSADFGFSHRLIVRYFLADGTVLITDADNPPVTSAAGSSTLLKRQRLPRKTSTFEAMRSVANLSQSLPQTECVGVLDLQPGKTIELGGRSVLIFGCSDSTRRFLERKYPDRSWDSFRSGMTPVPPSPKSVETRPNQALVFRRRLDNEQKVLRFRARLLSEKEVDVDYIISVFAVDNTVQVRAVDTPNSGLGMKVFLSRQPVPKPKADGQSSVAPMTALGTSKREVYGPRDFVVGSEVSLFGHRFKILEQDEFTTEIQDTIPEPLEASRSSASTSGVSAPSLSPSTRELLREKEATDKRGSGQVMFASASRRLAERLRNDLQRSKLAFRARIAGLDRDGKGVVNEQSFLSVLRDFCTVSKEDGDLLLQMFVDQRRGGFDHNAFIQQLELKMPLIR